MCYNQTLADLYYGRNMLPNVKRIVWIMFFLSGVSALVYEVIWTRQLTLVFGSTVFATSTVLTAFMAGLALGSFYFGRLADGETRPLRLYAVLESRTTPRTRGPRHSGD